MDLNEVMNISKIAVQNSANEDDSKKDFLDGMYTSKNDNGLSINLEKYYDVITRYRNGDFGTEHLSLAEILEAAGEKELMSQMSIEEIRYLIDTSSGITRMMFIELKKQKTNSEGPRLVMSKKSTNNTNT